MYLNTIEEFQMKYTENDVTDFFFEVMSQAEDIYEQLAFYQALKESGLIGKLNKTYFRDEMLASLDIMENLTEQAQAFEEYQNQFVENEDKKEREQEEEDQQAILRLLHEALTEVCGDKYGKVSKELISAIFSSDLNDDLLKDKRQQVIEYVKSRLPEHIKEISISVELTNENDLLH